LIKFAQGKNIKVILYTSPAYKTYVAYSDKNELAATIKVVKQLTKTYSNTYYYNWFTDKTFLASDFYDADHFNELGAKKFSFKVYSVINTLNQDK
jgi:hypothetical protein